MFFFFQAEDGIRDYKVTGVQTCALPILRMGGTPMPPEMQMQPLPRPLPECREREQEVKRGGAWSAVRSEERRVGKECRSWGAPEEEEKRTRHERTGIARK